MKHIRLSDLSLSNVTAQTQSQSQERVQSKTQSQAGVRGGLHDDAPLTEYVMLPFYHDGKPTADNLPRWGMTLRAAGSMRFRWDETNENRNHVLEKICGEQLMPVPLELIHSQTVYCAKKADDTKNLTGDGIITSNRNLLPVVTVADCLPIFLCDAQSGAFGVLHSGWKGTGIVAVAINLMHEKYGALPENILVAIGPHIRDCCYEVDSERASYFRKNFCEDCVTEECVCEATDDVRGARAVDVCASSHATDDVQGTRTTDVGAANHTNAARFMLSLEKANLSVLQKCGIAENNIIIADDCTCCSDLFFSYRREAYGKKNFPNQAAFCGWV